MTRLPTPRQRIQAAFHIGRALRLVWQTAPRWTLANVALVVVQGGLPLASLYVLKRILDAVAASVVGPGRSELVQHVWLWILVAGGLALLTAFARLVYSRRLYGLQREQTEQDRRAWYYHTVLTKVLHAKELRIFNLGALFQARY